MLEDKRNCLMRYPGSFRMRIRVPWLRLLGVNIGKKCWIKKISVPRNPWDIMLKDGVALDDYVTLLTTGKRKNTQRIIIGHGTYINRFAMLDASEKIEIGSDCMIGPYCYITDHDHSFRKGQKISEQELTGAPTIIGNDVWVGAHVTILKGVSIGAGAVIGAGSVVTKDIPPLTKYAGVPACQIGTRE